MSSPQLSFDFDAHTEAAALPGGSKRPAAKPKPSALTEERARHEAYWKAQEAEARAYWQIGMVTSLPLFCDVRGSTQRYTQMLPGVVESITGDLADVRIYAAPEYGYRLESYPLHLKLAVNVPLTDLGKYHRHGDLQRIVDEGRLVTGDEQLAAEVREREIAEVA